MWYSNKTKKKNKKHNKTVHLFTESALLVRWNFISRNCWRSFLWQSIKASKLEKKSSSFCLLMDPFYVRSWQRRYTVVYVYDFNFLNFHSATTNRRPAARLRAHTAKFHFQHLTTRLLQLHAEIASRLKGILSPNYYSPVWDTHANWLGAFRLCDRPHNAQTSHPPGSINGHCAQT